ncbi:MAG: hypothetical protein M3441_07530 [Chloroflexota bacterium]|nr:hypothetical protein [Chloroflexota bacterium]
MMKRVVYILGAGFSAPMGLPVISTFHERSEAMYRKDPKGRKHFERVFEMVRDLSVSGRFYSTNVDNIEEVLSTIEMKEFLTGGGSLSADLIRYIADVIKDSTPDMPSFDKRQFLGMSHLFGLEGRTSIWHSYACFVVSLFGTQVQIGEGGMHQAQGISFTENRDEPAAVYSIITFEEISI